MPGSPFPGVYVDEGASGARTISPAATSVAAFVGLAVQGPTDRAVEVGSFAEVEAAYGGLPTRSLLVHALHHFFANGGERAVVLRLAPPAAPLPDGAQPAGAPGVFVVEIPAPAASPGAPLAPGVVVTELGGARAPGGAGAPAAGAGAGTSLGPLLFPASGAGGLALLDGAGPVNLLCIPGEHDEAALARAAAFCLERRIFLVADAAPDEPARPDGPRGRVQVPLPGLAGEASRNAALYVPWVRAADPLAPGGEGSFPPCGCVAGLIARTDRDRGVWKAPAGPAAVLRGARGPAQALGDGDSGDLNVQGVNGLRQFPAPGPDVPTVAWGARTLAGADDLASEWKYLPIRRMALFLEASLEAGLAWTVFEPDVEATWALVRQAVEGFMLGLFQRGAFQGATPKDAYLVKCDAGTTTPDDQQRGVANLLVGFAPLKPAEFILLRLALAAGAVVPAPPARPAAAPPPLPAVPLRPGKVAAAPARGPLPPRPIPPSPLQEVRRPVLALSGATRPARRAVAAELARRRGRALQAVDLAAVVSKYVGETEKALGAILDAAERADVVLLLDEADALFGGRTPAGGEAGRPANQDTAGFLARLEAHAGLVVLSSNGPLPIDPGWLLRHAQRLDLPRPRPPT